MKERLKKLMDERGLGQRELARRAGLHETYVTQLLGGRSASPRVDSLQKLADVLGVTLEYLVEGRESSPQTAEVIRIFSRLTPRKRRAWIESGRLLAGDRDEESEAG